MTPLLLAAGDALPDSNLGKALALLLLLAMMLQPWVAKLIAKAVTKEQTAIIQTGTDAQTTLIVDSLNDVRHEVKRMREVQETQKTMDGITKTELADHAVRLKEHKNRLDGHALELVVVHDQIVEVRSRLQVIEKGRKP